MICSPISMKAWFITLFTLSAPFVWAGVALKNPGWKPHSIIRIEVKGGTPSERKCLRLAVDEIEKIVPLKFELASEGFNLFNQPQVELTLATSAAFGDASHSAQGNTLFHREKMRIAMSREVSQGDFSEDTCRTKAQGYVLHEFGHLLGLEHEHQHPDVPAPIHEVISEFSANFPKDQIDPQPRDSKHIYAPYDISSIMHYKFFAQENLIESMVQLGQFDKFFRTVPLCEPNPTPYHYQFYDLVEARWKFSYDDFRANTYSEGDIALLQRLYGKP